MGWRDTQAAVSSGKKNYYKNEDSFGLAFSKGADIIAKSWMQQAADEKEEAKIKAKEERAARRAAAERQRKAEDKAQKNKKNALILSETFSGTNNNPQAVNYFQQQLTLMDGDVGAVMTATQNMVESGRLEFTTETESLELQGPLLRRSDVDTDVADSSTLAAYKNAGAIDDFETKDRIRDTVGDLRDLGGTIKGGMEKQMDAILGPEGENDASLEPVEIEKRGIKITPFGETPAKLDYTRLKTLEDIELYKDELKGDNVTLDADLLKILEDREALLKGRGLKATINSLAGDLEAAKNQLQAAEVLGETKTDEYIAIQALVTSEEKNLKPWETIVEPDSFIGLNKGEMEQKRRVAKSLGAKDDDLKIIDAEITALKEIKEPIEWSTITKDNFEGEAKELEDAGDLDGAKRVREYGKVISADKPLSIVDLDKLSDDVLEILSSTVTDSDYKADIDRVRVQKSASAAAQEINDFNIADYDDVDTATITSIINTEGTAPQNIVKLQELLNNRNAQAPKILPGSETFLIKYKSETGEIESTTAKLNENNQYVDLNDPTKTRIPVEGEQVINLDLQDDIYDGVIKINQSTIQPLKKQRIGMATTLESAKKLDDLVNPEMGGNPAILTTVGGKVLPFIKRVGVEVGTIVDTFNETRSLSDIETNIDSAVNQYLNSIPGLDETTRKAALFQAEKIKLAFTFAASSLGQSGQGLSNKDFEKALAILDQGNTYETFSANLKSQAAAVVKKTQRMINDFNEDDAVIMLQRRDQNLFKGYGKSTGLYANDNGMADAFSWLSGKPTLENFLSRAREENPGVSDKDLTDFWSKTYGVLK
jgi:hypothetical protein